jgi:hypothetical protein
VRPGAVAVKAEELAGLGGIEAAARAVECFEQSSAPVTGTRTLCVRPTLGHMSIIPPVVINAGIWMLKGLLPRYIQKGR